MILIFTHPGSRGQRGTGYRIRNNVVTYKEFLPIVVYISQERPITTKMGEKFFAAWCRSHQHRKKVRKISMIFEKIQKDGSPVARNRGSVVDPDSDPSINKQKK
jgi:hypothetical protein